jgi:hypothetical protein
MDVFMIFDADQDCEASWLVDAWDEYTIDANYEGYEQAIKKARANSESGNIAIIKCSMDDDKVLAAFQPTEVSLTITETSN